MGKVEEGWRSEKTRLGADTAFAEFDT